MSLTQAPSDSRDFEAFYEAHFVPVMRYCMSIVKNKTDASDIVQQVFIVLWQKWRELDFHSSGQAYVYKMVYTRSLNFLEQKEVRKRNEKVGSYTQEATAFTDRPAERELQTKIEEAINSLPEQCGKIFRMSRNEGLKYREIATKLTISEKTVENQMGKALRLLRQYLQPYLPTLILLLKCLL